MDRQLNLNRICDLLKYHYPMPIDSIEPAPRRPGRQLLELGVKDLPFI
ncbi:MAG: hypothetical protein WAP98_05590 [Caldicoprobacterales bacterium]|jgi:hypothetical protein|nr:hypothetical protein [Clostridia bacterium]